AEHQWRQRGRSAAVARPRESRGHGEARLADRPGTARTRHPRGSSRSGAQLRALAILDRTPLPNAFPIRAQGFSFPDPSRPGMTPIVVRFTTDVLQYSIDADRGTYSAHVAVVV